MGKPAVPILFVSGLRLMGFLSSIFGNTPNPGNVRIDSEEGFVDFDLPMESARFGKDGTLAVVARGKSDAGIVGFAVEIDPEWKPQQVGDEGDQITLHWSKGHFRSIGDESDAFLALLAREYELPRAGKMTLRTPITLVMLGGNPDTIDSTPTHMKAFFEPENEDHYAEVFINLDIKNKIVEFHEKDNDYRNGLIAVLGGTQ